MTIVRATEAGRADIRVFVGERERIRSAEPEVGELSALRTEVVALKEALVSLRGSVDEKVLAARAEGRTEGAKAAGRDHSTAIAAIAAAADAAAADFSGRLVQLEGLAALMAHAGLARIFDRPQAMDELVLSAVRHQVAQLRRDAILQVQVSACDFPDNASLAAAAEECADIKLIADRELAAGACYIKLKLGEIDASLPTQWRAISALLLDMAAEDPR